MNRELSLVCLIFVLAVALFGCTIAPTKSKRDISLPVTERVVALIEKLEVSEAGAASFPMDFQYQSVQIKQMQKELDAYLQQYPHDVSALIAMARLLRLQVIHEPFGWTMGESEPPLEEQQKRLAAQYEPIDRAHALLDRAILLEPNQSEAYAWKARLYGLSRPVIKEGVIQQESNFSEAIEYSRKAVQLDPSNAYYQEQLAIYLVSVQSYDEALRLMQQVDEGRHLLYQLLADFNNAIPLPPGAQLWPIETVTLIQSGFSAEPYANARVRAYLVPASAQDLKAFYRKRWPGFHWLSEDLNNKVYLAFLRPKGKDFEPAEKEAEMQGVPSGLLMVFVSEHDQPLKLQQTPFPPGQIYSILRLVDYRGVPLKTAELFTSPEGQTPLHEAVLQGDLEEAKQEIAKGADVNARGNKGETPLFIAVRLGQVEIAKLLIVSGADTRAKDNDGDTVLHLLAQNYNPAMAELLLAKGADITATDNSGGTPLHSAALHSEIKFIELLLAQGANVNARNIRGETPLYYAVTWGGYKGADVAKFLISGGADVNAIDKEGASPLHVAACHGDQRLVELLLQKGANVNVRNARGNTPLNLAVSCHRGPVSAVSVAKLLLLKKADPNLGDDKGETPLKRARDVGDSGLVKLLSEYGAREE